MSLPRPRPYQPGGCHERQTRDHILGYIGVPNFGELQETCRVQVWGKVQGKNKLHAERNMTIACRDMLGLFAKLEFAFFFTSESVFECYVL